MIYDTIIIGGGPAGLTAAIYGARKNLKVLLVTKTIGGNTAYAGEIENYLGFTVVTGAELAAKFREDVERFKENGIEVKEGVEVVDLSGGFPGFKVKASDGQEYGGKTVIIASGRIPKMLGIPGEKEFLGRGVAICATCDAPLYKGKDVAVVGGGNSALGAVVALMKLSRTIYLVNLNGELDGDAILLRNIKNASNVQVLNNFRSKEIFGENTVTGLKIERIPDGSGKILPVQGVFIEVGYTPSTGFDKLTKKDEKGQIIVSESGETSVPGIWAAGDVNNLWGEQIIIAAGEGAKITLSVNDFLTKHEA